MQALLTTRVRRDRRHHGSRGHINQGRFKAFPCQNGGRVITLLRHDERNALRAGLVRRVQDWPHGSLHSAVHPPGPVRLVSIPERRATPEWVNRVNQPLTDAKLAALRHSVNRGTPFGSPLWTRRTATTLGLESTLRPRGRPKKAVK
jgi:putative transposase